MILDDETRRLLDDSHLLIATQRLTLLDIIGQGLLRCGVCLRRRAVLKAASL